MACTCISKSIALSKCSRLGHQPNRQRLSDIKSLAALRRCNKAHSARVKPHYEGGRGGSLRTTCSSGCRDRSIAFRSLLAPTKSRRKKVPATWWWAANANASDVSFPEKPACEDTHCSQASQPASSILRKALEIFRVSTEDAFAFPIKKMALRESEIATFLGLECRCKY